MRLELLTLELRHEHDVVYARQRARQIAGLLGYDSQDQTRLATALSEIARNAYTYAGGGRVEFAIDGEQPRYYMIRVIDHGPGIADLQSIIQGRYESPTGNGMGLIGTRRLMEHFAIDSTPQQGTTVQFGKPLPRRTAQIDRKGLAEIASELARMTPEDPFEEIQHQNQELIAALDELRLRQEELACLNRELEDTNRGVVALYAELDEKADYLRRAYEIKSRFLSNMSHEFRTPLNSILTLTQILNDRLDGPLTPEQEKQVMFVRRAAEGLSELVNDLLDLSKVEAGKVTVRATSFEIVNLFGALRGMLKPLLAYNGSVAIQFEQTQDLPAMTTDEGKVSQILRNFISNAIKFTEKGEIRVSATAGQDNTVVFAVADTGIGIAPQDQDQIFQEYAQIEGPRQHLARGTGLGLPLSRKLAQMLGGDVYVKSELGKGSTFYALIPQNYRGPSEVSYVPDVTREIDPDRIPVLIVEDNRETLFVYEKYLKQSRYQVVPARSLKEARQALRELRPVAVVLDILLENEYAWNFLTELKESENYRALPVFVVTIVDNQRKALALGADDFCVKPIDREWLLNRLRALEHREPAPKVLIIDDDEISRYLVRGLLESMKIEVAEAADGAEGLKAAAAMLPSMIILDWSMPEMTGAAVVEALRADPRLKSTPVVVHTSVVQQNLEQLLVDGLISSILPKTLTREETRTQLQQALTSARILAPQGSER